MSTIYNWVLNNGLNTPIELSVGLDKFTFDNRTRSEKKFVRIFVDKYDVTPMIAKQLKVVPSKAKDTDGCIILNDKITNGDELINRICSQAYNDGYGSMFYNTYRFLGRKKNDNYVFDM